MLIVRKRPEMRRTAEGVYISIRTDISAVGLHLPHAVLEKLVKSIAGLERED